MDADDDDDWSARSWTRFRALCHRLRLNDPNTTRLDATAGQDDFDFEFPNDNGSNYEFPHGYGSFLGQALLNGPNTRVSAIKLRLNSLHYKGHSVQELSPLLSYLRTGPALRRLHLEDQGDVDDMELDMRQLFDYPRVSIVAALLEAAGASNHLEELKMSMDVAKHHVRAFGKLLRCTKALRILDVTIDAFGSATARDSVLQALGANQTLTCFKVRTVARNSALVDLILVALSNHVCLQELCVDVLVGYLHLANLPLMLHSPTSSLRCLDLAGCVVDSTTMPELVMGMRHEHCTLEKLIFRHCKFDAGSVAHFLDFCQSPKEPPTSPSAPSSSSCALVELGFNGHLPFPLSRGEEEFYSEHIGAMAAQLLVPIPIPNSSSSGGMNQQRTVGSSLQRLVVDVKDYTTFFNTYAAHASHIYLPQLELGELSTVRDWTLLQNWLPQVVHLTDLTVHFAIYRDEASGVDVAALLRVLEGNTSLHRFRMKSEHISYCTPAEKQRIESILHRNQQGPHLAGDSE